MAQPDNRGPGGGGSAWLHDSRVDILTEPDRLLVHDKRRLDRLSMDGQTWVRCKAQR